MTTISASKTLGVVLNPASYTNPIIIEAGVTISNSAGSDAVSVSGSAYFFTLQNDGTISGSDTSSGVGVYLAPGGSVTNTVLGSIAGGYHGVYMRVGSAMVVNEGTIAGTGAARGIGVEVGGGSVTNAASASITGGRIGVYIRATGTVVNDGSIAGGPHNDYANGFGVYLYEGGSVTNGASASITGGYGIRINGGEVNGTGTVVNDGSIAGTNGFGINGVGVALFTRRGVVSNAASALITGESGVLLATGGTLTNAGTIMGNSGTAVAFGGIGGNLLVLEATYRFSGLVTGSKSASNTLELASTASIGTVTGLGTKFTNFGPIKFDVGADWSISGNTSGLAGAISGFAQGDTIMLTGVTETTSSFSGGILKLDETVGSATLDLPGTFISASNFHVAPIPGGTEVTVACFAAGTRILTTSGEMAVETLVPGDLLMTRSGELLPARWIGHRHLDCRRHPKPDDVWPVCVRVGAFGANIPNRDLLLSPDHAVFVDDVLIPIRYLINGASIVQEQVERVTYYHVELAQHDVILAEGLPCESYLDTGNRSAFANDGDEVMLHPGKFAETHSAVWDLNMLR